jgi:protein involved in polysaccharide export with SLBB domain
MRSVKIWMSALLVLFLLPRLAPGARAQQANPSKEAYASSSGAATDSTLPQLQHRPRYLIQRTDTVALSFPLSPEYNQTITVQPDGYVSLVGAGAIRAENMDVDQLCEAVRVAYTNAKILHDPIVTADLKDFQKPRFVVVGSVAKPGQFELRDDITVTQAVAIAGGFLTIAKHSKVVVFHRISTDWSEAKTLDVKHMLNSKNLTEDIHLQAGDIVYVPQNGFSKFKNVVPYTVAIGMFQQLSLL